MYSYSSGMSRQMTRLFARYCLNLEVSLSRCAFSITKMISAPLNQLWRQWIVGIVVRSRRGAFDSRMACEHLLSRWATHAILATDEEDTLHVSRDALTSERSRLGVRCAMQE